MYYFKQVENENIVGVEAKSVNSASPGFIEASKAECDVFVASLPPPPPLEPKLIFVSGGSNANQRLETIESFLLTAFPGE